MLRGLALVAGALVLAAPAIRPFPHVAGCVRADFRSGSATVRAERCGPASGARAVIVLHGCGGFSTFDHRLAAELPRHGISTLYVDYFGPTPPPGDKGFCGGGGGGTGPDPFPTWERVAADAAASLRPRFGYVGAVGWSLGAGVAIASAEQHGRPFDALAAFSSFAAPAVDLPRRRPARHRPARERARPVRSGEARARSHRALRLRQRDAQLARRAGRSGHRARGRVPPPLPALARCSDARRSAPRVT